MGIDTNFKAKNLSVNTSWKRFSRERNVTIAREATFPTDTTFFTIGSCFANELRHALEQRNMRVFPEMDPAIQHLFTDKTDREFTWGKWDERLHYQFYNTFSIRQEFEKAFGHWRQEDDDFFRVTHGGTTRYRDPYRREIGTETVEDFAELKNRLDEKLSDGIHQADTCVITLGMTEVFFRKDTGLAVCQYDRLFSDQIEFKATGYEENFANIDRVCSLYFGKYPDRRIVLSVSPVGLSNTFTDNDIIVANMESKSTLRAVAAAIARKWPNVVYWPSYEIVMWNENSWQADLRHVHPDRVASIMDAFLECHVQGVTTNKSTLEWSDRNKRIEESVASERAAFKKSKLQRRLSKWRDALAVNSKRLMTQIGLGGRT